MKVKLLGASRSYWDENGNEDDGINTKRSDLSDFSLNHYK